MRSLHQTQNQHDRGANGTNQIAYTWQLGNGVTFNIGADERLNKSLANLSANVNSVGNNPTSSRHGNTTPDPWVALRVSQAWGRAMIAGIGHLNQATYYTRDVRSELPVFGRQPQHHPVRLSGGHLGLGGRLGRRDQARQPEPGQPRRLLRLVQRRRVSASSATT